MDDRGHPGTRLDLTVDDRSLRSPGRRRADFSFTGSSTPSLNRSSLSAPFRFTIPTGRTPSPCKSPIIQALSPLCRRAGLRNLTKPDSLKEFRTILYTNPVGRRVRQTAWTRRPPLFGDRRPFKDRGKGKVQSEKGRYTCPQGTSYDNFRREMTDVSNQKRGLGGVKRVGKNGVGILLLVGLAVCLNSLLGFLLHGLSISGGNSHDT